MDMTTSAKQGLAMIRKQEYQLFLIDHMMPEMDGLIMLQKIKGMDGGKYKHIPAIAITANALLMRNRCIWMQASMDIFRNRSIRNDLNVF